MTEMKPKGLPGPIALALSIIIHLLLLGPAVYIVVLCIQRGNSLFVWHPACMAVGCGLLMTEAILNVSGESFLTVKVSRVGRVTIHWVLHTLGLGLMVAGFAIVLTNKNINGSSHFTSNHGIVGLVAVICSSLVGLGGILALNTRWFYPRVKPVLIKAIHICLGVCATCLLLAALITGLYRRWWQGSELGRSLTYAAYVIAGFFILVRPIFGVLAKWKIICK